MEKWGVPVPLAILAGLAIGTAAVVLVNGLLTVRTGINGFIITLATASRFTGINLGITGSVPFYDMPASAGRLRHGALLRHSLSDHPAGDRRAGARPLPRRARCPGRQLLAVGGNAHAAELSAFRATASSSSPERCPACSPAVGAILAVAMLSPRRSRFHRRRLAADVLVAPIVAGAARSPAATSPSPRRRLAVVLIVLIQKRHGAGQGRSLLGAVHAGRAHPRRRGAQPAPVRFGRSGAEMPPFGRR